ncbi:MAG: hypothetical protein SOS98_05225 [Varibaculum sp.]|nr:hypothetical protein [Varibaculum sp.]
METWILKHPQLGEIVFQCANDTQFAEIDPGWPVPETHEKPEPDSEPESARIAGSLLGYLQRLRQVNRARVLLAGEVVGRYQSVTDGEKLPLLGTKTSPDGWSETGGPFDSVPHLKIDATFFREPIGVTYRDNDTLVEFDPPERSRAWERHQKIQAKPLLRMVYPIARGLRKSGWALLVFLLSPLLIRLLPHWELPELHPIALPTPNLTPIALPLPTLTRIELPVLDLPELPTPPQLPDWLVWMLDHDKLWLPIIIGIGVGVGAVINHRRSQRHRHDWETANSTAQ